MKLKKITAILLTVLFVISMLAGCGGGNSSKAKKVVIGTQEVPNCEGIAKALGYFEEAYAAAGVEVEIQPFSSGAKLNAALLSGDIDFAELGSCPAANGLSSGIDYKAIWMHMVIGTGEALAVKNSSNINSVADLKGKVVASPFASTSHYSLLKALEVAGIAETDLDIVDMQPAEINAAWQRGDIDAAYVWEPTFSELVASDGKMLTHSGEVAKAGYMTLDVGVVRSEFAKNNPELVKIYIECLDKAVKLYRDDKPAAIEAISKGLEISIADAEYQTGGYEWLTAEEQYEQYFTSGKLAETLYNTAQFLLEQGSITSAPDQKFFEAAVDTATLKSYLGK